MIMNSKDCLTELDLTLHYYGELDEERRRHAAGCRHCTERLAALTAELTALPAQECTPDDLAGVRMAARVTEKLATRRRKSWLPALGLGAAAALALVLTFSRAPQPEAPLTVLSTPAPLTLTGMEDDMPDIDFLEDIELLKELELLAQIEGV
jgi:hypothetical protein